MKEFIKIEVVYAKPDKQELIELELEENSTVLKAIERSGLLNNYPEIDLSKNKVGIFNKVVGLDTTLSMGDRVSIFRELILTPNEARLLRAKKLEDKNK